MISNIKKNNLNRKTFSSQNITFLTDIGVLKNNLEYPRFEFDGKYGFSNVLFHLKRNEGIRANAGSMNYMTNDISVETTYGNSIFGAMGRMFSGSSFFFNIFRNNGDAVADLALSSEGLGDIGCFYVPKGKTFYVVSDSYVCSTLNLKVESDVKLGGIITGYGMVFISVTATDTSGLVWMSSFGRIRPITLKPGQKIGIDNGILLGFPSDINMHTKTIGNIKSTLFSGEGLITQISNDGIKDITIFTQGKSRRAFNYNVCNSCPKPASGTSGGKVQFGFSGGKKKNNTTKKLTKKTTKK